MSLLPYLFSLEETEVRNHDRLSDGVGMRVDLAMTQYRKRLKDTCDTSFGEGDESTARQVFESLYTQMEQLQFLVEGIDKEIDELFSELNASVLCYEDSLTSKF